MGSISAYLVDKLQGHLYGSAYTPASTVYLAVSLAFSVRSDTYRWTASGSGTSEYYLELAAGGDPGLGGDPEVLIANNTELTAGTVGSLSAGEWAFGDNDTLGYSTIYVRLADSTDPDTKAEGYVLAGGNPFDDGTGLNEPAAGSYARVAIGFDAAASRTVVQADLETFPTATAEWGWVTHWAIMDAETNGNMLAFGKMESARQVVINNTISFADGEVTVSINAGAITTYLAHKLLDLAFRNTAYTQPDTFAGLATVVVTDTDTGSTVTEPSGNNYGRVEVNKAGGDAPAWTAVSDGLVSNDDQITFGPPSGSWGQVVAVFIADADEGGNVLAYGNDVVDQSVDSGDTVFFPAGALDLNFT